MLALRMQNPSKFLAAKFGGVGHVAGEKRDGLVLFACQRHFRNHLVIDTTLGTIHRPPGQMTITIGCIEELFAKIENTGCRAGGQQSGVERSMRCLPRRIDI